MTPNKTKQNHIQESILKAQNELRGNSNNDERGSNRTSPLSLYCSTTPSTEPCRVFDFKNCAFKVPQHHRESKKIRHTANCVDGSGVCVIIIRTGRHRVRHLAWEGLHNWEPDEYLPRASSPHSACYLVSIGVCLMTKSPRSSHSVILNRVSLEVCFLGDNYTLERLIR